MSCNVAVLQPRIRRNGYGLGSSPFARHYWGNHCLFSVPAGTKMFQFPALASIIDGWYLFKVPGCPIRNPRIEGHLHLPAAYRSLSRPSSPPRAKASAMRPCLLSSSRSHIHPKMRMTYTCCFAFSGNWFILLLVTSCHRALLWSVRDRTAYRAISMGSLVLLYRGNKHLCSTRSETPRRQGLQKGGVSTSGTATLLRLSPNYRFYPRALLAVTHSGTPAFMA